MVKTSKSMWAQLGLGARSRDAEFPSAPVRVSEEAQAKSIEKKVGNIFEFSQQNQEQLPERPSTSAGPASSFQKRRNAEKRETKDDLHFNPLAAHGKGTTFYNFPVPGSLPTPATSPKSSPPLRLPLKSALTRPSTPESMEITASSAKMEVAGQPIGMALGSPAHPPTTWQQESELHTRYASPDQMDSLVEGSSNSPPVLKQKASRWKLLGGFFGGAKKPQPAFYQLQPEASPQRNVEAEFDFGHNTESNEKPKTRGRGRSNSSRKSTKTKPEMTRSNTVPFRFDLEGNRNNAVTPEITLDGRVLNDMSNSGSRGFLDVEIPSTQMERYSIMFGSVLQKPASQQSSLLARRQATLDKLKTVNEALASKERELEEKSRQLMPRRATSPQPVKSLPQQTQSPSFSLFPSTPSRIRDASPSSRTRASNDLRRSNTSPAVMSPARPTFAPGPENEAHSTLLSSGAHDKMVSEGRESSERSRTQKQTKSEQKVSKMPSLEKDRKWSPEQSHLTLDDTSDTEAEDVYDPAPLPLKPKLPEPHWQMVQPVHSHAPASSISASSNSGSDHSSTSASTVSTPPSANSTSSSAPKPQVRIQSPPATNSVRARAATLSQRPPTTRSRSGTTTNPPPSSIPRRAPQKDAIQQSSRNEAENDEAEARLKTAADVSIARQISVSRQQRQLLVPIKTSIKATGSLKRINVNGNGERVIGGQNFPTPASGIGAPIGNGHGQGQNFPTPANGISVGKVSSPLTAMAVAAKEAGSPRSEKSERAAVRGKNEDKGKLVAGVKPSTPTLVVVGDDVGEREKAWAGATATLKQNHMGLAERRRQKEASANQIGEIRVGLVVRENSPARGERELQHRKSERVVVERVSVASN